MITGRWISSQIDCIDYSGENTNDNIHIKGRILQIIGPNEYDDYLLPFHPHLETSPTNGYYFVLISGADINLIEFKSFFKRLKWKIKHRKEEYEAWQILMKKCDYKIGDMIEFDVKQFYVPTGLYVKEEMPKNG